MKKLLLIFLILFCVLLAACGSAAEEGPAAEVPADDAAGEPEQTAADPVAAAPDGRVVLSPLDAEYDEILLMVPSLARLAEYRQINAATLSAEDPDPDDFWAMMAIAVEGLHTDEMQDSKYSGYYRLKNPEQVEDYAATFLGEFTQGGIPSYRDSAFASRDPGSRYIDLQPISVSNYTANLLNIDYMESSGIYYAYISLSATDADGTTEQHGWTVALLPWQDGSRHVAEFRVERMIYTGCVYAEAVPAEDAEKSD